MKNAIIITATLISLIGCGGNDGKKKKPEPPPVVVTPTYNFDAVSSSLISDMTSNQTKAATIAVMKDGEIIFSQAVGDTLTEKGAPDTDTLFQLGSTQKMFTALATLQLVEKGIFSLDDSIISLLPEINPSVDYEHYWPEITLHRLLSQQSGLMDIEADTSFGHEDILRFATKEMPQFPLMTKAGLFYSYSNPNYMYAGALIERYQEGSFINYLSEHVFLPLKMSKTTMSREQAVASLNYALGGTGIDDDSLQSIDDLPYEKLGLAEGSETWSTPSDVLKMAHFLMNGDEQILPDDFRRQLVTKHIADDEYGKTFSFYGYGIGVTDGIIANDGIYPINVWEHGGNTVAYNSTLFMFPEHNLSISILGSASDGDYTSTILSVLDSLEIKPDIKPIDIPETSTEHYPNFVGTYNAVSLIGELTLIVTQIEDKLHIEIPELDKASISYGDVLSPTFGNSLMLDIPDIMPILLTFRNLDDSPEAEIVSNRSLVGHREGYYP